MTAVQFSFNGLWDIDDELAKIKRHVNTLSDELSAAGDLATGQLP